MPFGNASTHSTLVRLQCQLQLIGGAPLDRIKQWNFVRQLGLLRKNGHSLREVFGFFERTAPEHAPRQSKFSRHTRLGNNPSPDLVLGRFGPPQVETVISSPSIQLSLGGLLFSRARFCFTGQRQGSRIRSACKAFSIIKYFIVFSDAKGRMASPLPRPRADLENPLWGSRAAKQNGL